MGSGKSDNLLIGETHSVENRSQVRASLSSVGKSAIRGRVISSSSIGASSSPWDIGSTHDLNSTAGSKTPEVGVGEVRIFSFDGS